MTRFYTRPFIPELGVNFFILSDNYLENIILYFNLYVVVKTEIIINLSYKEAVMFHFVGTHIHIEIKMKKLV